MAYDGLTDVFDHVPWACPPSGTTPQLGISRAEQDAFAARSHQRAAAARRTACSPRRSCRSRSRSGAATRRVATTRGSAPDTTVESLAKLRPAFGRGRHDHRRLASPISDGACAVVVMGRPWPSSRGLGGSPRSARTATWPGRTTPCSRSRPTPSITALGKAGLDVADLDLVEINEAFAAVGIQSMRDLGVDPEMVNVNGGAIALGHPIGMSGARLALHLALELRRRGGGIGAAALCGGGGQGDALILTVELPSRR